MKTSIERRRKKSVNLKKNQQNCNQSEEGGNQQRLRDQINATYINTCKKRTPGDKKRQKIYI